MKKALPLALVLIGAVLLITAVVFWIDSSTSTEPQGFGKTLLDWVTLIAGLGASIKGWMDLFKKDKPTPSSTKFDIKGASPQISTGEYARNIQAETYIENQTVQQVSEPRTPQSLNQLPAPPLDFVGREKELGILRQNVEKGVLISGVQGMGGIGKTALGLRLAEQIAPNYPDGQIYLDLRGAHEQTSLTPEQIMAHVIRSYHPEVVLPLNFGELGAMYRSVLGRKKVLLFYDNARDENQLRDLLPPRTCTLFVTSRQYFALPGLTAIDLETLSPTDAIALVKEIVSKVEDDDAETLAEQCGYLPLAIRAAASVLSLRSDWTHAELIEQLNDKHVRLGLVEGTLSLSYDALNADLQKYLRQLGVFAAPFDKEAALAIWFDKGESLEKKTDDVIGNLLKTSLLKYNPNSAEYYFHDLTQIFLEAKLRKANDSDEMLRRYAQHYLYLANQVDDKYRENEETIPLERARFRQIWTHLNKISERFSGEGDWDLPKSSDDWLTESTYKISSLIDVCVSPTDALPYIKRSVDAAERKSNRQMECLNFYFLGNTYLNLGQAQHAIEALEKALAIVRNFDTRRIKGAKQFEGAILNFLGLAQNSRGDTQQAIKSLEHAIVIAREVDRKSDEGDYLSNLGMVYISLSDAHHAIRYFNEALKLTRESGRKISEGKQLVNLGEAYIELGNVHKAVEYLEDALAILQATGNRNPQCGALTNLGLAYLKLGDIPRAISYFEKSLEIGLAIGNLLVTNAALGSLGDAYAILANTAEAIKYYDKVLVFAREINDVRTEGTILGNMGGVYLSLGDTRKAIECYENALATARKFGNRRSEGVFLCNLGSAYRGLGELDIALDFHKQGLEISKEIGDRHGEGVDWDNLANVYADKNDYENALAAYQTAMGIANEVGDLSLEANIAWNIASIYNEKEQYEMACKYMQITIDFEKTINHPNLNASLECLEEVRAKIQTTTNPEEIN